MTGAAACSVDADCDGGTCSVSGGACAIDAECPATETCVGSTGPCTGTASDCETRWSTLHGVVDTLTTNFESTIALGAQLFPRRGVGAGAWGEAACAANGIQWGSVNQGTPTGSIDRNTAENNASNIMGFLPDADGLGPNQELWRYGATPTFSGLDASYEHLRQELAADPAAPVFTILVTDGAANCNWEDNLNSADPSEVMYTYDDRLGCNLTTNQPAYCGTSGGDGLVESAFLDDGIPTYVVGIDMAQSQTTCPVQTFFCPDPWKEQGNSPSTSEIEPYAKLNALAVDGGRPQAGQEAFYNASDPTALSMALQGIINSLQSCVVPLDPPPPFPDNIIVEFFDGTSTVTVPGPALADCNAGNGYTWVNSACDPSVMFDQDCDAIELCGTYCDDLIMASNATVDVTYRCEGA
jgi:hypothetical protein